MKTKPVVIILGILFAILIMASCAPACPDIGDKALDFSLQTLDGQQVKLSDYKGKLVMVNFWSTRCGPCIAEMPHLQKIYEEWSSQDMALLSINIIDSPSAVEEFISATDITFDILLDQHGAVMQQYCLPDRIPITLFIDKEGILRKTQIGSFSSASQINAILEDL